MRSTTEELRPLAILAGLPDSTLAWLRDHGTRIELASNDRLFACGQPADFMFVVVVGTIQRYEEIGGQSLLVATTGRGQVTGMLPYSRMTHYPGHAVAVESSTVLRIHKREFDGMLAMSHELGQRLVAEMSNRVRGDVRLEQQREKMMALGRLSAGLAHELNNPASAIRRTAAALAERLSGQATIALSLIRLGLGQAAVDALNGLCRATRERSSNFPAVERAAREDGFAEWLNGQGITDAWALASAFASTRINVDDLVRFAGAIPPARLSDVLGWVAGNIDVDSMATEISAAAARVSDLVSSVKTYSHMDRSAVHKATDVRVGIDSTLTMFGHKLKQKNIRIARDYPQDLPMIPGNAGELNQVWTNLIDNAVDAMGEGGELRIAIGSDHWDIRVRVIDNGGGIPEDIRPRIFDPFFTTKGVGDGTGLGLDIARRIVQTHRGQIDVQSRPGRTEMIVRLPLAPARRPEG